MRNSRSTPMLDPDRWSAVSPHLDVALEIAGAEREAWLASFREREPSLADDLQALLAEHAALDEAGFLARPPQPSTPARPSSSEPAPAGSARSGSGVPEPAPFGADSLAGQTIGAYTLMTRIGEGGMGTVWLARRNDGRFEGFAAVKLLNASLMSRTGAERFTREGTDVLSSARKQLAPTLGADHPDARLATELAAEAR